MPKISELPTINDLTDAKIVASDANGNAGNITASAFAGADDVVESVVNGTGISVDNTDPQNPVVSVSAGVYATAAQGAKADTAVQPGDLATVATSGDYDDLSNTPSLATVATSGSYLDLGDKPTLGSLAAKSLVEISDIDAGGTPDNTKFLRGDGEWVTGGVSGVAAVTGGLVDNTDPNNPVINDPGVNDIDATGTPDNTTYLRGDGTWATIVAGGDVVGPASSTGDNIALFDGATGKLLKDSGSSLSDFATVSSLATVATSGDYDDLSNKPSLGTAASADTGDFATAAQGNKADSAVQPGALGALAYEDDSAGVPYSNATSGLTATDVQAAIDEIAAGGGSDWEQIGAPVTASSGTSVAFTSIPADYSDLVVILFQVRHNHSSGTNIYLDVSDDNGTTWSAGDVAALPTVAQNTNIYGRAYIYDYNSNVPFIIGTARAIDDPAPSIANSGPFMTIAIADGGLNALRFRLTSGAYTGSGTFTLFGSK